MVKALLFPVLYSRIPNTDGPAQIGVEFFFHGFGIPPGEGGTEGVQPGRVSPSFRLKPFLNLLFEDLSDFPVRNGQTIYIHILYPPLSQVARGKKYTPQIVDTVVQLSVGQLLADAVGNGLSGNQGFQVTLCPRGCYLDKFPNDVVSAGIDPVSPGKGIRFRA